MVSSSTIARMMNQLLDPSGVHTTPYFCALLFGLTHAMVEDLTRSAITIIVFIAFAVNSVLGRPQDPILLSVVMLLLGYYIGRVEKLSNAWMKEHSAAEEKEKGRKGKGA